jgi:transposase-like protein
MLLLASSVCGLFKWRQFEPEVILLAVGWYLRFSLSYRDVEELLAERGLHADHVTVWRWVQRYAPELHRPVPYLNNVLEQDHRAIKRRVNASQHSRSFCAARRTLAGYEAIHMIRKGQASGSASAPGIGLLHRFILGRGTEREGTSREC